MLGHVTGTSTFDDQLQGMLHLKVLRSPHAHARLRRLMTEAERARRAAHHSRGRRAVNSTRSSPHQLRQDDEPSLAVDKVRYKAAIVAIVATPGEASRRSRKCGSIMNHPRCSTSRKR
jgi:xanthine dehydrogenase molybdopterin-binding subunit B